jgi:heme A synthase
VLVALIVAIVNSFAKKDKPFASDGKKPALLAMIAVHIQFLVGLILFFTSPKVVFSSSAMRDDVLRFFLVEHNTIMLIAIVLITIGYSRSKRLADDAKKFKSVRLFYLIGLILILIGIPWPWRNLGVGWV